MLFLTINILNSSELIQLNMGTDLLSCTSVLFAPLLLLVQFGSCCREAVGSVIQFRWLLQRGAALQPLIPALTGHKRWPTIEVLQCERSIFTLSQVLS